MQPLTRHFHLPAPAFTFAGFTFPRWVATMPRGSRAARVAERNRPVCGPYYHAPQPGADGRGFYLASDGMPGLRWAWCDECDDSPIHHRGWFADDCQDATIRGVVFRLPKSRGFLAGWSMGESMASSVDSRIFETMREAAIAADDDARRTADHEREYR